MKAIVCRRAGSPDVLTLEDVEKPAVPDDGVLVRVHAASANIVDLFPLTRMGRLGRRGGQGQILGADFAGTVAAVGRSVTEFQPGDEVFGGSRRRGAFAEYICVPESGAVARKPAHVTFEQAAAIPIAGSTALQAVRDHGRIQVGQRVLVNGASGGVGTFAVQIAKAFGAEVTAVCGTRNLELVRSLGADRVIDYTHEDFTRGGQRYDVLLDVAGSRSWGACRRVLAPKGTFVAVGAKTVQHLLGVRLASIGASQRVVLFIEKMNKADLVALGGLLASGRVAPAIERRYALSEVPKALRYLAERHANGKLVITV